MSYLVLARKLRPSRFKDIVGQDHIWKTLINAIETDRVAHAFLFTGPRGTGKTSCARILTKALNCQNPVDFEPCNTCENCVEINKGISADVMEIDAASNRGIEHIRELRDGVKFSPAKCRYKTYIIDEVHMLTTESFNALLKTLEEPPSHVKFILATTDPHKIPTTVISRCQRYDFTNISMSAMVEYLKYVAEKEDIQISSEALRIIAGNSAGGMRDALTTMDMLISFSGTKITDESVVEILGVNDYKEIDDLLSAIVRKDLGSALTLFQRVISKGRSLAQFVADLMKSIKDLSLVKSLPSEQLQWYNFLPEQQKLYTGLATHTTVGTLQQYFNILLEVEMQIKRSSQAKVCIEMGLIKLCSVESMVGVGEFIAALRDSKISSRQSIAPALGMVGRIPQAVPAIPDQALSVSQVELISPKNDIQPESKKSLTESQGDDRPPEETLSVQSSGEEGLNALNSAEKEHHTDIQQAPSVKNSDIESQSDRSVTSTEVVSSENNSEGQKVGLVESETTGLVKSPDTGQSEQHEPKSEDIKEQEIECKGEIVPEGTTEGGIDAVSTGNSGIKSSQQPIQEISSDAFTVPSEIQLEGTVDKAPVSEVFPGENVDMEEPPDFFDDVPALGEPVSTEDVVIGSMDRTEPESSIQCEMINSDGEAENVAKKEAVLKDDSVIKAIGERSTQDLTELSDTSEIPELSSEEGQPEGQPYAEKHELVEKWKGFVDLVSEKHSKSLVSLLRNAVLLKLTEDTLAIGFNNLEVFTNEKKKEIANLARNYFNPGIKVYYKARKQGIDASLKDKDDAEAARKVAERIESAKINPKVLSVLEHFPGSKIKNITTIEELDGNDG